LKLAKPVWDIIHKNRKIHYPSKSKMLLEDLMTCEPDEVKCINLAVIYRLP